MYGGTDGTEALDELWVYDEANDSWELLNTIGTSPGPRQGHVAAALGNVLIIWGGKNGSTVYKDMFMYNTNTNVWEEVQVKSTVNPTAAEGACMVVYEEEIYIFGGINKGKLNNKLWKFNIGSYKYESLDITDTKNKPDGVSYSNCWAIGHTLYIANGILETLNSPKSVWRYNLKNPKWETKVPS